MYIIKREVSFKTNKMPENYYYLRFMYFSTLCTILMHFFRSIQFTNTIFFNHLLSGFYFP